MSEKFLRENAQVETIDLDDAIKLFQIRRSYAYTHGFLTRNNLSKFQFMFNDGATTTLVMVVDSPKIKKELYDQLLRYSDEKLNFAFWYDMTFHVVAENPKPKTDNGFYILDNFKTPMPKMVYWLVRIFIPDIEKKLAETILQKLKETILVEDLARALNVSTTKIGLTLQKNGNFNEKNPCR